MTAPSQSLGRSTQAKGPAQHCADKETGGQADRVETSSESCLISTNWWLQEAWPGLTLLLPCSCLPSLYSSEVDAKCYTAPPAKVCGFPRGRCLQVGHGQLNRKSEILTFSQLIRRDVNCALLAAF